MKKLLIFILCLASVFGYGQQQLPFTPIPVQDTIPASIHEQFKARLKKDKEQVVAKGKVGSYMKTLYDQRFDYIVKTFNEDYIMVNDDLTKYVQGVLSNIYDANPQLPREATIYTYRSETPNAMSFGEGTLCMMLGLLARIETEDVLAFVLCHELAHHHASHTDKKMEELADLNYDRVLKKQIDEIMSSPYGRYTKMKALFTSLDISVNKHSREKEYEADSIGLTYFLRTKYNRTAPLRCMQILSHADSSIFTDNLDLKKHFTFTEFPFKDTWAQYKRSDVWYATSQRGAADTASTHPDCMKRFEALKRQLKMGEPLPEELKSGKSIPTITTKALFELVHTQYHFKQYGKSLFYSLNLAERFPNDPYPHAMVAKSLYQLYKSQKNHELGKVLELPDPRFEENYDRFLQFMHKLRLVEVASLAYHYSVSRPEEFYRDEEFLHAVWMCSRLEMSKLDPGKVLEDYEMIYPKGRYLNEMKKN